MAISLRTWPGRLVARPWLLAFVPINAATAGFGVVLPLLILIPLHGSWADVAVAATLFNSAVILSSVAWGRVADRSPGRRLLLVVNYAGYGVLYLVLTQIGSLPALYVIYTAIGLLAPAGANAANLLILEKFSSGERANAYASFQEMSIVGSVAGLLVGYFWTLANAQLLALLFVLAALALSSAFAIWFGIREATTRATPRQVLHHPESLVSRLRISAALRIAIPFFPHRPTLGRGSLARFRRWAREELRHELPLVMAAGFLFNLSSNLYNISYTPYLFAAGLSTSAIFLVNCANNLTQTFVYPLTGGLSNRFGPDRLVRLSSYLRSVGYLATAGFTIVAVAVSGVLEMNLIVYAVLGAAIAVYTTASSLMLFRGVEGRDAGRLLGVNSALGGAAAVGGAALSGLLAVVGSYRLVFLVAAGALLASVPIWAAATVAFQRRRRAAADAPAPRPPDAPRAAQTD
ncbi:MAG TPA: MFS transporter [Thermoplasmata archaeon]|jgi:MFS family permease|nr:MFS transporter [Thermoplasmata archaeon]